MPSIWVSGNLKCNIQQEFYKYFIFSLFFDISSSYYIASNDITNEWNGKDVEGNLIQSTTQAFARRDQGKSWKASFKIAGLWAMI
jgi:hypothetical protein